MRDVVVGAAMKSTLTSIQRARENLDRTSERLATGLKVNRATDQPQNFFSAFQLNSTASNFTSLLDKMNIGVRTIQQAAAGVEQIENLLNLAEIKALDAKEALEKTGSNLSNLILNDAPVGYFQLYDADSDTFTAENLGTLGDGGNGIYTNGVQESDEILFFGAGGKAAKFNGSGQYVAVPNDDSINTNGPFPERTVELIFNANSTSGRQVLWEEGGTVNSMNIYIDNGRLHVNGRTTRGGGYGPFDISVPIEAGKSYHVAFTQDGPSAANGFNGSFTGYVNGQSIGSESINTFIGNHPNQNGIGAVNENVYYHDDGPGTNAPTRPDGSDSFSGQISDVAIYNNIIDAAGMRARYEATSLPLSESFRQDMQEFLKQIQGIVEDTNYRGINLLDKEDLIVDFNDQKTSKLKVDGRAFDIESLKLDQIDFQKPSQVENAIVSIRKAIAQVREYGSTLANDLNIIETRQDFTRNFINNYESGATDLLIADQNEEGANLLSAQIRLDLSTQALSLAAQSSRSILELFGSGSNLF